MSSCFLCEEAKNSCSCPKIQLLLIQEYYLCTFHNRANSKSHRKNQQDATV